MTLLETILKSKELRKVIVERSIRYTIPLRYVCKEVGIDYMLFMRQYINSNSARAKVTEEQFRKIFEMLGINIRYQFVINEDENEMKERSKILENKHGQEERSPVKA